MDITTLAAWGEFLGGIAVVVSLVYLAGQIRQNSKLMRASTASFTLEALNAVNGRIIDDPEVARIYHTGCEDRNSLSEPDRQRFDALTAISFGAFDQQYDFFQDDVMSQRAWIRERRAMLYMVQQRGIRQWWTEWGDIYSDEFIEFVNGLIREAEAAAPTSPAS
jgi:hypothetical protein